MNEDPESNNASSTSEQRISTSSASNVLAEIRRKKALEFERLQALEQDSEEELSMGLLQPQTTTDDGFIRNIINGSTDGYPKDYQPPNVDGAFEKQEVDPLFDQIISIPNRVLYDMTRNSDNMKKVKTGKVQSTQELSGQSSMTDLSDSDCNAIQKEIQRKKAKWHAKQTRPNDFSLNDDDEGEAYDEEGGRRPDAQVQEQLIDDGPQMGQVLGPGAGPQMRRMNANETWSFLGGQLTRGGEHGRVRICCLKDLDMDCIQMSFFVLFSFSCLLAYGLA